MKAHVMELNELIKKLGADAKEGLSSSQAKEILEKNGENKLIEKKKKTLFQRFIVQFADFMVIILLIAAAISFTVALKHPEEMLEPFIILGIVILNAILGVAQESKAEKALEALQNMSAPNAKVMRNGRVEVINSSQIVVGDVVFLEAGDFIPADGRLIESSSLKCEESALTGESVPVEKDAVAAIDENAPLGDRLNMVYSGCSVTYGRARVLVTSTGMQTEMGKIAQLLNNEGESGTPLQERLNKMGKLLGILALVICAIIFVIGIVNKMDLMEIFMVSVSLAVAAIPEGLPAIITIVLALGVQRMVKRNAIIRRLPAVETLGSASVICSDKTGTLTQNRMTLVKAWVNDQDNDTEDINEDSSEPVRDLLKYATLCCDARIEMEEGQPKHIGDPTETAIVYAALINQIQQADINKANPRIGEIPFDSDRKLMTTVHEMDEKSLIIVKGAFDVLATKCISGNMEKAKEINDSMARNALRVLAVGYRVVDGPIGEITSENLERDLTLKGLVGMIDPPREEAKDAVETCIEAGIRTIMITGDHVVTASAIAKELGILKDGDEALTGVELAAMSDEELSNNIEKYSVYARVSPEDKIRIVKAWQDKGQVVSMTGDGVNDAPALKAADIGCAMGITGTDVAKGAADMVLTDDNFATIVEAVKEGRGIYDNIKKAIAFLLSCNVGEIFTVFIAMLIWQHPPLAAIQILWINLVTDSLPALALGMEPAEYDIMQRKPKPKNESIFADKLGVRIFLQGLMFAALTLAGYYIGRNIPGANGDIEAQGQTMAFLVLAISQLFHAFNMRSVHSLLKIGLRTNKHMLSAFAISFALVALIVFVPVLAGVFGLVMLSWKYYLMAIGLAFVPVIVIESIKLAMGK